jgi:alpha-L-fucosidase
MLLNVGPKPDGSISDEETAILREIGEWLKVNGEAIYGTAEGPTGVEDSDYNTELISKQTTIGSDEDIRGKGFTADDFRFTAKDGAVYAVAFGWPKDGKLFTKALAASRLPSVKEVRLLGYDIPLTYSHGAQGLRVTLPEKRPCEHAYALKIT